MDDIRAFAFEIDGHKYTLAMPLSIAHNLRLRKECGFPQNQLVEYMVSPDLDVIAICAWLARLQAGEDVSFAEASASITYQSDIKVGLVEDDHPES